MMNRTDMRSRIDKMLGTTLNTDINGWDIILICPDATGVKKQHSLKALISNFKDEALVNQTVYNTESKIVKIFIKDIETLRLAGKQIPLDSLKKVKATVKIDNVEMSIIGESLQGNKRILVLKCNRLT